MPATTSPIPEMMNMVDVTTRVLRSMARNAHAAYLAGSVF